MNTLSNAPHPASNSIVTYLRMLTSAKIRTEPDDFAPFLIHPELGEMMDPKTFCETNVDPTGKEAGEWAFWFDGILVDINLAVAAWPSVNA